MSTSTCALNFTKMSIPVKELSPSASNDDRKIVSEYVYDDGGTPKIDMCVKKCNSGSIPINGYMNPDEKFKPTLFNITAGAKFACFDNASTESTDSIITYKCSNGVVMDNHIQTGNPKCGYTPNQYPIKKLG